MEKEFSTLLMETLIKGTMKVENLQVMENITGHQVVFSKETSKED